ncbi:SRPBCC family protein [uncultured Jatrophihabitans sp.]|uniref:SRPBCC family protein n=1 Tax=uncultured Jatrophihabitans sp. TaxID=1610747 RepID=UPI0035CB5F10
MVETGGLTQAIAAPADKIVAALLDFDSYPEWSDNMLAVRVMERDDEARPLLVRFVVDAKVRKVRYTSRYRYDLPHGFSWHMEHGDLKSLSGSYRFEPHADGRTDVTIDIAFEVGFYVPGPIKRVIRDQALRNSMQELRERVGA